MPAPAEDAESQLSAEELAAIPTNPAGMIELSDDSLRAIGGGADTLWTGDAPPTPTDVDTALAAVDDPLAGVKSMFSR